MLHVIVTGVSQGLGEALARELLARGARVLGVGRRTSPRLAGEAYRFVECDLADVTRLSAIVGPAFEDIASRAPRAICLVNNAATLDPVGVIGSTDADAIARSLCVNLTAPIVLAGLFCRSFASNTAERRIVNVSSGAAQSAIAGESLYSIGKSGLEMLTRALAAERPSRTLRAITLRPGIIDTPMQAFARSQTRERLPSVDLFQGFHQAGQLVPPDVVARKVIDRLVLGPIEHGRTYSYAEL
jgi:NAD(P)-dependent dehydrogenase (short-subunit alcohol dehydrogenase family)